MYVCTENTKRSCIFMVMWKWLKKNIHHQFLMMTSWSRVPFQYDKIPLQYLKKKQKTWMFKSWFVVTAKIHETFWSISSACRETIMVLFCFEEDIYCVFWFVLFFNDLSPGLSDISKRESLHELYSFELLWCRKLCLFVEFLGFLSR